MTDTETRHARLTTVVRHCCSLFTTCSGAATADVSPVADDGAGATSEPLAHQRCPGARLPLACACAWRPPYFILAAALPGARAIFALLRRPTRRDRASRFIKPRASSTRASGLATSAMVRAEVACKREELPEGDWKRPRRLQARACCCTRAGTNTRASSSRASATGRACTGCKCADPRVDLRRPGTCVS